MKQTFFFIPFLVCAAFAVSSCSVDKPMDEPDADLIPIHKKWTLQKEENRVEKYESIEFKGQPIEIVMDLNDNGYFIIYDTFLDPRFEGAGINKIQQRSRGQWEYRDDLLILHHSTDDTSYTENLTVNRLSNEELILQGENEKATIYKTFNKR